MSVAGVDRVIGEALPGAKGATIEDQDRIDDTIARACAVQLYSIELCDLHTAVSAARRAELKARPELLSSVSLHTDLLGAA